MVSDDATPMPGAPAPVRAPRLPPPPPLPVRQATLADRIEYGALRAFIGGLARMNAARATRVGATVAMLGYRPLRIRRHVVERQIAAAFPDASPERVATIARASYAHLGRMIVETARLSRMGPADVLAMFEQVDGWDIVEMHRAAGRGPIIITGHLGNWELGGAYLAARGLHVDAVVRLMGNPLFDAYLARTRMRLGMMVVRDHDAVRRTPRTLRAGGAVAFLADQAGLHLASTYVPFFGRLAKTPRGPAVFALRLGAPLVFGAAVRQPNGRYRLRFEEIPVTTTGDRDADVEALVGRYTGVLERHVRAWPEQYFWHHHRWKQQPPDTPPAMRDPV